MRILRLFRLRRRRRRYSSGLRFGRLIISWILFFGLGAGLVAFIYGMRLDRMIRDKFEGQRWALPARVYARPLEFYANRALTADQFESELKRLSYHVEANPANPGTYHRNGDHLVIRTRPFRFWDGAEPGRHLSIDFTAGHISRLDDADGGPEPTLVRLDAVLIANIYPTHNEDRMLLHRPDLPDLLVKTLIAVEDRHFYRHHGVDPKGIIRAAYSNFQAGSVVEGASTLTQQLVKNFYLNAERTVQRKIKEAAMSLLLELHYSKDEILETYANEIYLGQDGRRAIHGFGLASVFFFNRSLKELTPAQTALLIGLVQAPSALDPRRHPEAARKRRDLVLDLMVRDAVITESEAQQARDAPLGLESGGGRPTGDYPDFVTLVRRQLQRDYRDEDLKSEGLQIFTTLDPIVQATVERALQPRLTELESSHHMEIGSLEVAAVVTSVTQGEILAVAGGRKPGYAGFNRALDSERSIGSLVKPAVYLTALSHPERYALTTNLQDRPVSLRDGNKWWTPENYDRRVHGTVPLYDALARSLNLATVNLGLSLGVSKVAETLNQLGIQRKIHHVPSLLLGSIALSPLEIAQMYQTIAAGGYRSSLRAIREVIDAQGRPLNRYPLAVEAVVDPKATYLTTWAMQRVVTQGTAKWLGDKLPEGMTMAGKTGTTDGMRDSWFAGFSGDKVAVVWLGRDDYQPMGLAGGAGALRVWGDFMLDMANEPLPDNPPEGIVIANACGRNAIPAIGNGSSSGSCGRGKAHTRANSNNQDNNDNQDNKNISEKSSHSTDKRSVQKQNEAEPIIVDHPKSEPSHAPPDSNKNKPKANQKENLFMSDFYGH